MGVHSSDELTRRDFLRAAALGGASLGLTLADPLGTWATTPARRDVNCILLFLTGGPSQLDTWDPKPSAPARVRGPFRPIRTSVPGIHLSENFPRMARVADRFAIVRSVHHDAAPVHETGQQLMQTGRLFRDGPEHPHYGAVVSHLKGRRRPDAPPFVVLPWEIGFTGVSVGHGQGAGYLDERHAPVLIRGGRTSFGRSCRLARRLIERGSRFVTVNMFDTVFRKITWDCHAAGEALLATLDDYRDTLCPAFDRAYTSLLEDLHQRGMLDSTLVVAMGEFGRTPYVNPCGGRDHWPGVWSILFAGGGVRGGQVVGSSDRLGGEPNERPVSPAEVAATIYHALGIDERTRLAGPGGRVVPLVEAGPVAELFG
jgi:uncharacterized protein (DUF1501 family)